MISVFLFTLAIGLFVKYLWDRKKSLNQLEDVGIPGPPPKFWSGNIKERTTMGLLPMLDHYTEKYGDVWGYYEGTKATVVISDVEMMKEIYIKEFSKFHSRKLGLLTDDEYRNVFDSHDIHQWKRLRAIGSPSFSALRMKEMSPLINTSIDNLLELFAERCKSGKAFNIHSDWQRMTMETIASCAFGIDTNSIKNPDSPFLKKCLGFFAEVEKVSPLTKMVALLLFAVPALVKIPFAANILSLAFNTMQIRKWFLETAKQMINARKLDGSKRVDFIKLMLDANEAGLKSSNVELEMKVDDDADKVTSTSENDTAKTTSTRILKHMSLKEMQANCFVMLIAGYETTSTALGFASYELALNPDVQKKLQAEIDEHFTDKNCRPNYISVQKMQYLDMFICELLRLHTIAAAASSRHCYETCQIGGYTIKSGMQIQMNIEAVHMNPDLWGPEDPKEFVPERFLPERKSERHPIAWIPFGGGPRNCIGMRFALMELKIALVRILKNYNIEKSSETQVPIQKQKRFIRGPAQGVFVKLTARN